MASRCGEACKQAAETVSLIAIAVWLVPIRQTGVYQFSLFRQLNSRVFAFPLPVRAATAALTPVILVLDGRAFRRTLIPLLDRAFTHADRYVEFSLAIRTRL